MSKAIADHIASYVEEFDQDNEAAMEWYARWQEEHPDFTHKPSTVTSHFSRLKNGNPTGTKFYFGHPGRGEVLLDVLEVSDDDRKEILELAKRALADAKNLDPRLIVDLSEVENLQAHQLNELKSRFFDETSIWPLRVLIRPNQRNAVTLDFTDTNGIEVESLNGRTGREWIEEHAAEDTLIASTWPFEDYQRWIAISFERNGLRIDPNDGLEHLDDQGVLEELQEVQHLLSDLFPEAQELEPVRLPASPTELRKLYRQLRDESWIEENPHIGGPEVRLALGRELGIDVTSTAAERERAEMERLLREAGFAPEEIEEVRSDDDVKKLAARARLGGLEPICVEFDGRYLLYSHSESVPEEVTNHERFDVRSIDSRTPPLAQLLDEIEDWNGEDFLDDPSLDDVIEQLDPAGELRLMFRHARAGLFHTGALKEQAATRPEKTEEWREPLAAVLEHSPPAACIHVQPMAPDLASSRCKTTLLFSVGKPEDLLDSLPLSYEVLLTRERDVDVYGFENGATTTLKTDLPLPRTAEQARDVDAWSEVVLNYFSGEHDYRDYYGFEAYGQQRSELVPVRKPGNSGKRAAV